jgi:uncharacterized RmlC-like cupin family protein
MLIPAELSSLFSERHFHNYPLVDVPQIFKDQRGSISNIADGRFGDVAVIESEPGAVRANHYHDNDWHLSYLVSGSMKYLWKETVESPLVQEIEVSAGQMVYSPPGSPHKMVFLEKSIFIAVAALSRNQENYETDTHRLGEDFFNV